MFLAYFLRYSKFTTLHPVQITKIKMKKIALSLLVLILVFGAIGQAKDAALKVRPLSLAFGIVNVAYEKSFTEFSSGQLGGTIVSLRLGSTSISGFGISPEYRFYRKEALSGFYWSPFLRYSSVTAKDTSSGSNNEATASGFGTGLKLGWNWLLGKSDNFVMDLGIGAQYINANIEVTSGTTNNLQLGAFEGFSPVLQFAIGYAFD